MKDKLKILAERKAKWLKQQRMIRAWNECSADTKNELRPLLGDKMVQILNCQQN